MVEQLSEFFIRLLTLPLLRQYKLPQLLPRQLPRLLVCGWPRRTLRCGNSQNFK